MESANARRAASPSMAMSRGIEVLLNVMVAKAVPVREIIKAPDYEQLPRPAAQLFHLIAIGRVKPREVLAIGFRPGRKEQAK